MVHKTPGRWSRKTGGRYSQFSFCMNCPFTKKQSLEVGGRFSLQSLTEPVVTVHMFTRKSFLLSLSPFAFCL